MLCSKGQSSQQEKSRLTQLDIENTVEWRSARPRFIRLRQLFTLVLAGMTVEEQVITALVKNRIDIENRNLFIAFKIAGVQCPGTHVTIYGLAIENNK